MSLGIAGTYFECLILRHPASRGGASRDSTGESPVATGGFPLSGLNFVNIPLRVPRTRGIKDKPSRVVWLAGRFIRISWRSSGIK